MRRAICEGGGDGEEGVGGGEESEVSVCSAAQCSADACADGDKAAKAKAMVAARILVDLTCVGVW